MRVDISTDPRTGSIIITTLEPVHAIIGGRVITIAPGYRSDGFSCPRCLWWLLSPAIDPRTIHAAVVHDYLYEHHLCSRREADDFLRDDLVRHGFGCIVSMICWCGVRAGGWLFW